VTKQRFTHLTRTALPFVLATCACAMVPFFDNPDPAAAGTAWVAWCLFVGAIARVGRR